MAKISKAGAHFLQLKFTTEFFIVTQVLKGAGGGGGGGGYKCHFIHNLSAVPGKFPLSNSTCTQSRNLQGSLYFSTWVYKRLLVNQRGT